MDRPGASDHGAFYHFGREEGAHRCVTRRVRIDLDFAKGKPLTTYCLVSDDGRHRVPRLMSRDLHPSLLRSHACSGITLAPALPAVIAATWGRPGGQCGSLFGIVAVPVLDPRRRL